MKTDAADNETFFRLTPELVLEAAEDAGFVPSGHTWTLNSLENRVYDLRLEDGSHVVAKFYRPGRWTREQLLAEHSFLFELRDAEIPVCVPLTFPDGSTIREREGILFAVWPRTGGRAPDELSTEDARMLGRMLGRLHNVGESHQDAAWAARPAITADSYVRQPLAYLEDGHLPPSCARAYTEAALQLAAAFERLAVDVPRHRIHGDCHLGNLLRGEQGYFLLDFDDACIGPAIQDVWMLFPRSGPGVAEVRAAFLEGYRAFRDFADHWWELAEALRGMRFVHYAAWVARRFRDPAFQNAFPHFGTLTYWEQETADLVDQARLVCHGDAVEPRPGAAETAGSVDGELTNRDFFWDWEDDKK